MKSESHLINIVKVKPRLKQALSQAFMINGFSLVLRENGALTRDTELVSTPQSQTRKLGMSPLVKRRKCSGLFGVSLPLVATAERLTR